MHSYSAATFNSLCKKEEILSNVYTVITWHYVLSFLSGYGEIGSQGRKNNNYPNNLEVESVFSNYFTTANYISSVIIHMLYILLLFV